MRLFKFMYFLSWFIFIASALMVLFIIVFSSLGFLEYYQHLDIPFTEIITSEENKNEEIAVDVPFTGMSVRFPVQGFFYAYLFLLLLGFGFYFFLMKNFFKSFIDPKVFDAKSLLHTRRFFGMNILIFVFSTILNIYDVLRMNDRFFDEEFVYSLLFLFIGILVYYYLDLMKKGHTLQSENDLTI